MEKATIPSLENIIQLTYFSSSLRENGPPYFCSRIIHEPEIEI